MEIQFTTRFLKVLDAAEEIRKEEKISHISEMNMLTAEYIMPDSALVLYAKKRGIRNGILEEILAYLNHEFELSDEKWEEECYFLEIPNTEENKHYRVSKIVGEAIMQSLDYLIETKKDNVINTVLFIDQLAYRKKYAYKLFAELEKCATISVEEINKQKKQAKFESETEGMQSLGYQDIKNQEKRPKPKIDEKAIPRKLKGCLTLLNEEIQKGAECEILGRDYETREIEKILLKTTKRNAILIGEAGVGKTAIVEKLVWNIVNEKCPNQLKNKRVISLNVNGIVARTKYRGEAEERFKLLIDFLESNPDVILFIDEMHGILGAGSASESNMDLGNALKPILARGQTRVIGATTSYEYDKYFPKDPALKRRFEPVNVKEPKTFEVYPMIKNKIRKLEESHEVLISKELVDFCIYAASCYKPYVKNPDRTLDLIDTSMALANLEGTHMLTKEIILKNFERSMDILKETPIEIKESTAYHEAGHYLLGKLSKSLASQKTIAVTIIPYEGKYMGANVYEPADGFNTFLNKDYFIQEIASLYAGRIAEEMKTGFITAGARSDAERATKLAKDYVTKYAMSENISTMRVYSKKDEDDVTYLTEEKAKKIDTEIDNILKEGYQLAQKVLEEHREELDKLSQELLCKSILSEEEITELLEENDVVNS